jgi:hypothetical protein
MRKINAPFAIAILLFAFIVVSATGLTIRPSQVSNEWWLDLNERDQAMFLLGYQASSWAWSHGLVEANALETLNGPTAHVYRMLAPAVSYGYDELRAAITNYYRTNTTDLPVWAVITNYATEFKHYEGGL